MRSRSILLISLLLLVVPAFAAVEYDFRQSSRSEVEALPGGDSSGRCVIDGDKSRIDFFSGSVYPEGDYVLTLDGARRLIIVDPTRKTFTEISIANVASSLGSNPITVENLKVDLQKLDDHPIIAGFPTNHFRLHASYDMTLMFGSVPLRQSVNTVIDKWTTMAFGDVGDSFLTGGGPKTGNPQLDELIDAETSRVEGLPLRQTITITTARHQKGNPSSKLQVNPVRKQTAEMLVTSVRNTSPPASYFEIPVGFSKAAVDREPKDEPVHMLNLEPAPQQQ